MKAEGGRVRRSNKALDVNRKIKNELLMMISQGSSLHSSLKELSLSYPRYHKWLAKDLDFKRNISLAREGRCELLHESFYEKNIKPITTLDLKGMDTFDLQKEELRSKVVAKNQSILTTFKKEDAPQLYNKELSQLNVENTTTLNFNIDTKELGKVVSTFTPKISEGEIISERAKKEAIEVPVG